MKKKIILAVIIILTVFALNIPSALAEGGVNGTLRVKLSVGSVTQLSFTIDGNYAVEGNDSVKLERKQYTVKNVDGKLYLYCGSSKLCGGGTSLRLTQLTATEGLNNVIILYNKIHDKYYGYLGDIQFLADSKYVLAINHIYIEDYLYGVVPYEMNDSFPQQALRAQAVAARNYAAKRLGRDGNWDLTDDSSKDQVYKGFSPSAVNSIEAVNATKGQVLVSGTTVIDAFYSASNGGWTDVPYHRWGSASAAWNYYRIDYDQYDIANPASRYETITIPAVIDSEHPITTSTNCDDTINWKNAETLIKKAILDSGQLKPYGISSIDEITPTGVDDIPPTGYDDIPLEGYIDLPATDYDDVPQAGDDNITAAGDNDITVAGISDFTLTGVIELDTDCYDTDSGQNHSLTPWNGVNDCEDKVKAIGTFTVSVNGTSVTVTNIKFDLRELKSNGSYPAFFAASLGIFVAEPVYDGEGALTAYNLSMRRFGHALGLSQRGAQQRAKSDDPEVNTYDKILAFYYPNTTLVTRNYKRLETHTVTFETNGGNTKEPLAIRTGSYITTAPTATKAGYTLEGWYLEPELSMKLTFPYVVTEDVTLYAKWTAITYTIGYDLGGGKLESANPASYTIETPEFTLANPKRAGYIFTGWTGTGLSEAAMSVTIPAGSYGNRAYKANWNGIVSTINSAVSTGYDRISLTWSKAESAIGYEVLRATSSGGAYSVVSGSAALTETQFTNTGLKTGTTYYYKIRGIFNDGTNSVKGILSAYKSVRPMPSAPASCSASEVDYDSIKVAWSSVPGASGYMVYRATSETGSYSKIATTSKTYYTNNSRGTGTTYYYKVRAYRNSKSICSGYSPVSSAVTSLKPTGGVTAKTYYPTSIKISWNAVPGRTKYEIWRSLTGVKGSFELYKTTTLKYYNDKGLKIDQTYYYQVRAYRTVRGKKVYNEFSLPASDTARISKVTVQKAAMYSVTSNKISWSAVTGASGYEIVRCDSEGGNEVPLPSTKSTYCYDSNLTPNQMYYYKIRAYIKSGTIRQYGPYSDIAAADGKVNGVKAVSYTKTSIKISWNAVSGRDGYEIWRSLTPSEGFVRIIPKSTTPYTSTYYIDSGLTTGTTYYYKVLAYDIVNGVRKDSGFSITVNAKP